MDRTVTQASPVPACAATFDSASRVAFAIAADDRGRDGRAGRVVDLDVDGQPPGAHVGDDGAHLAAQVAGRWRRAAAASSGR